MSAQGDDASWSTLSTMTPNGLRYASFAVAPDEADSAHVIHAEFPPGYVVGPHQHETDYVEIIVSGSQRVGRRWYRAGDVRFARRGTVYGPLTAGPDGAEVLIVFADDRVVARPPRPGVDCWIEPTPGNRVITTPS